MTDFEEELAALLALDALEPDEQADGELHLGTFPPGFAEVSGALAGLVAAEPPPGLRAAMLDRATDRRRGGRPVDAVPPCSPAEAFARTVADLQRLLATLTDGEWNAPAHPEHGRVRDLVAHLVGIERLSLRWLQPDESLPTLSDHVAATRAVVAELAETDPWEVARIWHGAAQAVSAAAASCPAQSVSFHDLQVSVPGLLVIRTFELWAHAMDISVATGRSLLRLDSARMTLMSGQLMTVLPDALAYRGGALPGRSARFVLTGAAGGCYTVPLAPVAQAPSAPAGEPDFTLVADAIELCRLAARRLRPDELAVTVEGDRELAELVLADLDAFARD